MTVARLLERLEATNVAALDAGGVSARLRDVARLKGCIAGIEAELARRANQLAAAGTGLPADEVLGRSQSMSRREAQRASRRADTLGEIPAMSRQLRAGRIGADHADALVSAASQLDDGDRALLFALDAELATHAAGSSPEQFRRHVDRVVDQLAADRGLERAERQRRSPTLAKGINRDTGMYWRRAELDPESGVRVFSALDAELAALVAADRATTAGDRSDGDPAAASGRRRRDQLAAQALVGLVTSAHRSQRPGRTEMLVVVDYDTIVNDLHDHSICEYIDGTELPAASPATPRSTRSYSVQTVSRSTWAGPTATRHHHLAHEGGWQLDLDPTTRELTARLADGTLIARSRPDLTSASVAGQAPPGRRQSIRSETAPTVGQVA